MLYADVVTPRGREIKMALTSDQIIEMSTEVVELLQSQLAELSEEDGVEYLTAVAQAFSAGLIKDVH